MTYLSPHFSLEELIFSDTAKRMGIDNDAPLEVVANLKRAASNLERVRQLLNNNAIRINSGYRCEALERKICSKAFYAWCDRLKITANDKAWSDYFITKQHPTGNAIDFTSPYGPPSQLMRIIKGSGIMYDQLIQEFGDDGWVHISFSDHPRMQTLIIDAKGTRNFT